MIFLRILLAALLFTSPAAPAWAQANGVAINPAIRPAQLPAATTGAVGGVRIGTNITVTGGVISLTDANIAGALGFTPYDAANPGGFLTAVPAATDTTIGGVIVGSNLTVDVDGVLSLTAGNVEGALGYTPYNAANPSGYITSSSLSPYLTTASAASTYLTTATAASTYAPLASPALTGHPTGVTEASSDNSTRLATTAYVTTAAAAAAQGLNVKAPVRLVSTSNITVATPGSTIDGTTPSNGDRIGLVGQSTASQNGIYVYNGSGSAMTRATDAAVTGDFSGQPYFFATAGSANSKTSWTMVPATITVGTTAQVWNNFAQANSYTAGTGLTLTSTTFAVDPTVYATVASLAPVATAGTYASLTGSIPVATGSVFGGVKSGSNITNTSGVFSLTSGNVTGALGFTPYNATNPSGYLTSSSTLLSSKLSGALPALDASLATVLATGSNTAQSLAARFADTTYAKDYGVLANTTVMVAPLITVASGAPTVLSVAGANFVSGDVGKTISVQGIGVAGANLTTTIATRVSATDITLTVAASTFPTAAAGMVLYGHNDGGNINQAINVAVAKPTGGTVMLPPGIMLVDKGASQVLVKSNLMLRGVGRGKSIILIDDMVGTGDGITNSATANNTFTLLSDFHMRDITVMGLRQALLTQGSQLLRLGYVSNVSIEDCEFIHSRYMGMIIGTGDGLISNDQVTISHNRVLNTNRDGIGVWNVANVIVTDNQIQGANDDAISVQTTDSVSAPVRSGIVVANNMITESQGIAVIGAKTAVIANNVLKRMLAFGIRVRGEPGYTGGNTPMLGVRITGNVIADVFRRNQSNATNGTPPLNDGHWYIFVGDFPKGTDPSAGSPPGIPVSGTGLVTSLYGTGTGNFYTNDIDAGMPTLTAPTTDWTGSSPTVATPGAYWLEIAGNHLIRTLPAVAAYSDWGYSNGIEIGAGGTYNGAVTEAMLNTPFGIALSSAIKNSRIAGNLIQTSGPYGIAKLDLTRPQVDLDLDGLVIEDNRIFDYSTACILPAPGNQRITVRGNECDADPYFRHTNRAAAGGWTANSTAPYGLDLRAVSGVLAERNTFRNLNIPIATSTPINNMVENWIVGDPAVTGWSSSNKGVGTVSAAGGTWRYLIETSDPTSASYGQVKSQTLFDSSSIPTTGTYVVGHFVRNSAPAVASGKVLMGWSRLTTGTAHVSGTDWSPVYATVN